MEERICAWAKGAETIIGKAARHMATRQSTIDFLIDQLSSLRSVRTKKMFGEYALYCDEKVVALVCDDQLFVKITAEGKALVGQHYQEGFAYPGAKPSMLIGADDLEDHERLCRLIRATADALPPARPKKPKAIRVAERGAKMAKGTPRTKRTMANPIRAESASGRFQRERTGPVAKSSITKPRRKTKTSARSARKTSVTSR